MLCALARENVVFGLAKHTFCHDRLSRSEGAVPTGRLLYAFARRHGAKARFLLLHHSKVQQSREIPALPVAEIAAVYKQ